MKYLFKLTVLASIFLLLPIQECLSQTKVTQNHQMGSGISISTFNGSPDVTSGFWNATNEDGYTCIQLMDAKGRKHPEFIIGYCLSEEQLPRTSMNEGSFSITREAGVIEFTGQYDGSRGSGNFRFSRNKDFASFLNSNEVTLSDDRKMDIDYYFLKLFLGDVTKAYVSELKKEGYNPSLHQLGKMGVLGVDLNYMHGINGTYLKRLDLDMLIKFAVHDIDPDYIHGLEALGYGSMDPNMIKKFAIHSISLKYIEGINKAGYSGLDPNMLKKFAIHSISVEYIESLNKLGYDNLDPNTIKKFAIHSISASYIKGLQDLGYNGMDTNTIKNFAIHSVSLEYIKSLQNSGIKDPSPSDIKKAKIHSVTSAFIKRAKHKGHESQSLADYTRLKIKGI
jgi:hypothetical protein